MNGVTYEAGNAHSSIQVIYFSLFFIYLFFISDWYVGIFLFFPLFSVFHLFCSIFFGISVFFYWTPSGPNLRPYWPFLAQIFRLSSQFSIDLSLKLLTHRHHAERNIIVMVNQSWKPLSRAINMSAELCSIFRLISNSWSNPVSSAWCSIVALKEFLKYHRMMHLRNQY